MKKKLIATICSCFAMSLFLGSACFSNLMNKIKLVSDNVEALTKDYESRYIDGEMCNATELGVQPTPEELNAMPAKQTVWKCCYAYYDDQDQSFLVTSSGASETLHKCNVDLYGYGFGNGQYCWLKVSYLDRFSGGRNAEDLR